MSKQHVLLIHGILMRPLVMRYLGKKLGQAGFHVCYANYRSLSQTPQQNAQQIHDFIRQQQLDNLHIVAHSLGGIVALHLLQYDDIPPGHVVMLGSPVTGSYLARRLHEWLWIGKLLGNSLEQGLSGEGIPEWPEGRRRWGMICGNKNLGFGWLIGGLPEQGDGTVMTSETRHPQQYEHTMVAASHTGMLFSTEVANRIIRFLRTGSFVQKSP